jgi:hypothetical protein
MAKHLIMNTIGARRRRTAEGQGRTKFREREGIIIGKLKMSAEI